jgi:RND family efflux transporter MFP subunit
MKQIKITALLIVVITSLTTLIACGKRDTEEPKKEIGGPSLLAKVTAERRMIEIAGMVKSADVADLASRFGGFVTKVLVRAGNPVKKGQLLVVLDERNLQAQLDKLQSASQEVELAIKEARSQLEAAEAQKELAENTFNRIAKVYQNKAASRQEFEEAETRRKAADAAWQAAKERVSQMESKRQQLQSDQQEVDANFGYVRLTAPFDGLVTSVTADEGTFANAGQTLVVLERPSAYQVIFSVEEDLLEAVREGESISVWSPSVTGKPLKAVVSEVSPSLDRNTRTFQVKADLSPQKEIRGGVSAKIILQANTGKTLWIPMEFLMVHQGLESVIVKEGSDWNQVLVKTGRQKDAKVEILSGLNEGDVVGRYEAAP